MNQDPISDILRLADVESVVSGGFTAGGEWAIRFPAPDKLKFFASIRGSCGLQIEGEPRAFRIEPGDVLLLTAARAFTMASHPAVTPVDAPTVFEGRTSPIVELGGGQDILLIGGHVRLDPAYAPMLAEALPPLVHVRASTPEARFMRWILDSLVEESRSDQPGSGLAMTQLAHLLFVHILRAHLSVEGPLKAGWLRVAADRRLAPALRLMHGAPGKPWRLDQLAQATAMSRTLFASHFKVVAGIAPLTYLAHWRMRLAQHALRRGDVPVTTLARDLGYASESAFSHAFKRIVGVSPSRYGHPVKGGR
ncbi:AraC-like DNA-binding protein [Luteibacter sp. W1I16]|uniref:AraC family transcriptional regulator n=1 Tax=Luteibacter sp. W1I16 TaxID=3373922 RepID=UPI003D21BC92